MKNALRYIKAWVLLLAVSGICFPFNKVVAQDQSSTSFHDLRNIGLGAEDVNLLDSAISSYKKAESLAQAQGSLQNQAIIANDLGIVHRKKADYVACKQYHQKAGDLALKSKDQESLEMSFHGLGSLFEQTGDYDDAIACYLRTLNLTQERNDPVGVAITRQNLAKTYMQLRFQDASIKEIENALSIANGIRNDSLSANVFHDYAEILIHFKDYSNALTKMESALKIYEKIGYERYIGSSLVT